ncbi:Uncharacterised protein [Actinomyces bovis]|uniref:Tail assembly chaperone n=1 Tax=Actinomyces bovis TaxID=1658 RepID=A0ABY1VNW8_9ACTO|nr:hypothetical protein [Actinomyces bovis]SPT53801.1 Uncharacterised protein [Actinomyces bovis]VEG53164.1 Uncharacterised protein [Actinomyces israelii]
MTFQVPASKASIKQNLFEFTLPQDDKIYALPKMQFLDADLSADLTALTPRIKAAQDGEGISSDPELLAEIASLQRQMLERYVPGIYARMSGDQVAALVEAWQEASSVTLGEFSSSAGS